MNVEGYPHEGEDDDLTDWERLQVAAAYQILRTGKATIDTGEVKVLIDYTDRLNEHATPQR